MRYIELIEWIKNYDWFCETEWNEKKEHETKLINYQNQRTGVYFQLEYGAYLDEWEDWEKNEKTRVFAKPNLYLRLNVPRPTYFAIETAGLMSWMCRDLNLFMIDKRTINVPEQFNAKRMLNLWMKDNEFGAQIVLNKKFDYIFWSEEESTEIWKYNYYVQELLKEHHGAVAESVYGVVEMGKKKMKLATKWLKGVPMIIPKTDYVILLDQNNISTPLSYKEVIRALLQFIQPISARRNGTMIIKKEHVEETDKIFEYLLKNGKKENIEIPECTVMDIRKRRYNLQQWILIMWWIFMIFFIIMKILQ